MHGNRLRDNTLSGIALLIGAQGGVVVDNTSSDNHRYAMEIAQNAIPNQNNIITGNRFAADSGSLGAALDDQGSNLWVHNWYSSNRPYTSPYLIPGTAGATDVAPVRRS